MIIIKLKCHSLERGNLLLEFKWLTAKSRRLPIRHLRTSVLSRMLLLIAIAFVFFPAILHSQHTSPKRELRGAWLATVANIDYPESPFSSSGQKITELKSIFEKLKRAGINCVYFQVRTECDALYQSAIEPWSYWLTGKQGSAPQPFFDPLRIAITEAHERGMELHAWLNPFRAVKTSGEYTISPNHISVTHPEWILTFKDLKILDPGNPKVHAYVLSVVDDIVTNYDIDGIHFDDYFYPYAKITTEDAGSFALYNDKFKSVDDWRRNNISTLIADANNVIKSRKKYVLFGISPFGIVLNKYAHTNGFESYDILYCDPLTWLKRKSVDYLTPQLYWEINSKKTGFAKLFRWWSSLETDRNIFAGHYASNFLSETFTGNATELQDQIRTVRSFSSKNSGSVFFSAKTITRNWKNFCDTLEYGLYQYPTLLPQYPWLDNTPPTAPGRGTASIIDRQAYLNWEPAEKASDGDTANAYVVYKFQISEKIDFEDTRAIRTIIPATQHAYSEYAGYSEYIYFISSLDRLHNESANKLRLDPVKYPK